MPMNIELLSRVLVSNRHIALFLLILLCSSPVFSQSVLLPSDLVVVSVNSSDDSFDFIPLVPLQEGTSIWFSNGVWNADTYTISGEEIEIVVNSSIDAGTNIHINSIEDPRVEVKGQLDFTGLGDRLIAFQKDEGVTRVLYGIGWGSLDVWNPESDGGSVIPLSISKEKQTFLQLGLKNNYQYYLRNGASGTAAMLNSFVADPAHWRSRSTAFPSFGTAFRILKAPVVLFEESISTVSESESIILNVAIYEHDGSRLTVDVAFNEYNSLADTNDIDKFNSHTFNFTGLIGDAVYAIEVPLTNDSEVEGNESAFFELQNLSKGNFGDFISHVAFIQDDEIPNLLISEIVYSGNEKTDYIEIVNNERIDIDISGWKFISRSVVHEFNKGSIIPAFQTFKVYHPKKDDPTFKDYTWLSRSSGTLELKNEQDELVSDLRYRVASTSEDIVNLQEQRVDELNTQSLSRSDVSNALSSSVNETQLAKVIKPAGWYLLGKEDQEEVESYFWNEQSLNFELLDPFSGLEAISHAQLVFLSEEEISVVDEDSDSLEVAIAESIEEEFRFTLSATDYDENGIVNGSEGFNFLSNTTNNAILVSDFIESTEAQLFEGAIYPYIYLWNEDGNGWMNTSLLEENDLIPAKRSFWVRADSAFEATELSMIVAPYIDSDNFVEDDDDIKSQLSLSIRTGNIRKQVAINFFEENEELARNIISPELEDELRIQNESFLFFGAGSGLNWHSEINSIVENDQKSVFPLSFESSESGQFNLSIVTWQNIPADWTILVEDTELDKEYELNENWTFEFEFYQLEIELDESERSPVRELEENEEKQHRFNLVVVPPGVQEVESTIPEVVSLHQNFPNPFNPTTTIAFYLPESVPVTLAVFNIVGQPVAVLTEGVLNAGDHEFEWDATGLPSGMYIYQLEVGNNIMTRKMTLVK